MKHLPALTLLLAGTVAHAQAWDTNTIRWTAPTACTTGEPVAQCPVTGYRVERAGSTGGTYASVATVATVTTYAHTGAAEGRNCYRVIALSASGNSAPSNVACKTNVKPPPPAGPPNPPTNLTVIETTAYNLRADFQKFAFVKSTRWGKARLGAACDESRCLGDYCVVVQRRMLDPQPAEGEYKLAKCG